MDKHSVLAQYFGYSQFRQGQEALIDSVLAGRDVLGIMPTGGGKSICYQVPALLLPGLTVVISPLISLMQDQVQALRAAGVPADFINSTLSSAQMRQVFEDARSGRLKLLYVAPERLEYGGFSSLFSQVELSFLAVDEAHCISQWGQDFRPSYLRILDFIQQLPCRPRVGAFTATATAQVQEDIVRILDLADPCRVVTGFDRPNLYFDVRRPRKKDDELLSILSRRQDKSGIVYCSTRKQVEAVTDTLTAAGYAATRYHAGLSDQERRQNQEDFLYDRQPIMVATNAFGMGIDKSNVSYVIHYNMPKSIEAYYQEAGRAGRDGTAADCILLFAPRDVQTARFLIESGQDNEALSPVQAEAVRREDRKRLYAMVDYCKTKGCLRSYILSYFGQPHTGQCGACGTCQREYVMVDITREAQIILSCVLRIREKLGYYAGAVMLRSVLIGSRSTKLHDLGLHTLSTYGLMRDKKGPQVQEYIDYLLEEELLFLNPDLQILQPLAKARGVLFNGERLEMPILAAKEQPRKVPQSSQPDSDLYQHLRAVRTAIAAEKGIPAYMVFNNATLESMAARKPQSDAEFLEIPGVGQMKAAQYGQQFLECIRIYLQATS